HAELRAAPPYEGPPLPEPSLSTPRRRPSFDSSYRSPTPSRKLTPQDYDTASDRATLLMQHMLSSQDKRPGIIFLEAYKKLNYLEAQGNLNDRLSFLFKNDARYQRLPNFDR